MVRIPAIIALTLMEIWPLKQRIIILSLLQRAFIRIHTDR